MGPLPDVTAELCAAAQRLVATRGDRSTHPSFDPKVAVAWDLVKKGDAVRGRAQLLERALAGSLAASGLAESLDRYGPDAPRYEEELQQALDQMCEGDGLAGYARLVALTEAEYGPAAHFLGWIHRYRAASALETSAGYFEKAVAFGHRSAGRHLDRVREALQVVDFRPPPGSG